jgi:hypothetical protein
MAPALVARRCGAACQHDEQANQNSRRRQHAAIVAGNLKSESRKPEEI